MNGYFCSTHYYSRFDTSLFMKDAYPVTNALPVHLASSSDQFPPFAIQMFSVCVTRHPHSSKLSLFGSSASSLCDDLCVHSIKGHVLSLYVMCVYMCTLSVVDPGFLVEDLCVHSITAHVFFMYQFQTVADPGFSSGASLREWEMEKIMIVGGAHIRSPSPDPPMVSILKEGDAMRNY